MSAPNPISPVYLVTGALGCLGAWTLFHLVKRGAKAVSFDLHTTGHRVDLLLSEDEKARITFVQGDLTHLDDVMAAFRDHAITHVIHLAALQVPFCRANPVVGAQVNVVGTVNLFEAAKAHGVRHLTYASSIAVYGPPSVYPPGLVAHDAQFAPTTLYGVYKQADEGIARIYWNDYQLSSTALRPYTVYGIGRDQGLTSDPTKALLAAAAGQPFHINYGGNTQFQSASDCALQFILAADQALPGAFAFNMGGSITPIRDVVQLIMQIAPAAQITYDEKPLAFPDGFDDSELRRQFSTVYETPLDQGFRETFGAFRTYLEQGRITA